MKICSGAPILATHTYKRNPDSPLGNEIDLQQGDVLSYIMEHEDNEHWWLAEDSKGEVGYVPVSYLMMIVDDTVQEEGCDKTRTEGQEKSTDRTKIGEGMRQYGGRRKKYSAAVIGGIKRNSTTYVGDSIFFFFFRVLHTSFSHLRAHAFARSVTVARSSAVQASSSRRQERRWAKSR